MMEKAVGWVGGSVGRLLGCSVVRLFGRSVGRFVGGLIRLSFGRRVVDSLIGRLTTFFVVVECQIYERIKEICYI